MRRDRRGVGGRGTSRCCSTRAAWVLRTALVLAVVSIGALTGCGGDDDGTSPASLKDRLLPVSELPGFKIERNFEWDNPIDFVHDGLPLPETTPLSAAVEAFEDFGFEAGVGEGLVVAKGNPFEGPQGNVGIVQLGSDEDARKAFDYVRKEALKQPCFAVCAVDSREFAVAGIPGAKGVQHTPLREPPPNAPPPFEDYGVGFTIGPRLYLVGAGGGPGQVKKEQVLGAARALYEGNAKSDAAS
jgi:hypothetical protein